MHCLSRFSGRSLSARYEWLKLFPLQLKRVAAGGRAAAAHAVPMSVPSPAQCGGQATSGVNRRHRSPSQTGRRRCGSQGFARPEGGIRKVVRTENHLLSWHARSATRPQTSVVSSTNGDRDRKSVPVACEVVVTPALPPACAITSSHYESPRQRTVSGTTIARRFAF